MRPGGALVFVGIGNGAELPATVRLGFIPLL